MEVGDDAERCARAANCEEDVLVFCWRCLDDAAVGKDHGGVENVVACCAELTGHTSETANSVMTANPDLGRISMGGHAGVLEKELVDISEAIAGPNVCGLVVFVIGQLVDVFGVDYYPSIVTTKPCKPVSVN